MEMEKKKILLVEDDKMISSMYKTKLEQEKFEVITAEDGAKGLDTAVQIIPDLILLDIILPQIDGFAVLQELKLGAKTKDIPVIMLTNLGTSDDKAKAEQYGSDGYIVKSESTPAQICEYVKKQFN
ncbi:response regulator [bacterium]|nr:response regulator [bacterium]